MNGPMDPETERHFAAIIMEEAARLRLQAEKEGVHAYLAKPKVRGKPNPQFLKATVRNIAQANRAAEVNGMWKQRAREIELEERERKKHRNKRRNHSSSKYLHQSSHTDCHQPKSSAHKPVVDHGNLGPSLWPENNRTVECMSNGYVMDVPHSEDEDCSKEYEDSLEDQGLEEEEIEQFLHSRAKRGRGAVGSRMDETGPYPSVQLGFEDVRVKEEWEQRILGPSKEIFERQLLLESSKRKKSKQKMDTAGSSEFVPQQKHKRKKKESKKKHKHSHKKSKKGSA